MTLQRDVFICHTGEDEPSVVRPLAEAFKSTGISFWLDEAEIRWGDSITSRVNKGLQTSKYVLVVLSSTFLTKPWPQRELDASLNQESSTGEVRVLPLLVGDGKTQKELIKNYPLLNDKFHLVWQGDTQPIVTALQRRLGYKNEAQSTKPDAAPSNITSGVYIPPVKRSATQRDKDLFIKQAFSSLKAYFQEALQQLEASSSEIETDFTEIHNQKFICTIYLHGEIKNQCRVLVGDNLMTSSTIVYAEGRRLAANDSSINEMAVVEDTASGLAFGLVMNMYTTVKSHGLNPQELVEHLWRRFVSPLS